MSYSSLEILFPYYIVLIVDYWNFHNIAIQTLAYHKITWNRTFQIFPQAVLIKSIRLCLICTVCDKGCAPCGITSAPIEKDRSASDGFFSVCDYLSQT